ncbi:MAG: hypothetical protein UR31_C0009G0011 [Parcubacteria group bacterium GW2011_GWA2_33_14]|nr:MAG: hypothetical protein UR31_C0009G0011 [Parcubacteria group bacterium GW2011_GWA2_33_14]
MQKVWLWFFGGMFVVPEVLWTPVINFYYGFLQTNYTNNVQPIRDSFLFNYQYENLLKGVILLQFIGIILFFIFWIRNKKSISSKLVFWIILFISLFLLLIDFFVFGFAFSFSPNIG